MYILVKGLIEKMADRSIAVSTIYSDKEFELSLIAPAGTGQCHVSLTSFLQYPHDMVIYVVMCYYIL